MAGDIFMAGRWWLATVLIGLSVLPLCRAFFRDLPSQGVVFAKLVGLLLVSWLFWLMGNFGWVGNSVGGILLAWGIVAGGSWLMSQTWNVVREDDHETRNTLPVSTLLASELIFLALFAIWVWVRMQNPSITATEKPMEFAFLNAVTHSEAYPPLDPWLSGFSISYYYFGYVMMSVLGRLAVVPTAVGFNLSIAWIFAATGTAAFGLISDLVRLSRRGSDNQASGFILGTIGALAIPAMGNLQTLWEHLYARGIGSEGFWTWLNIKEVREVASLGQPRFDGSGWWWWRSSRVINEINLDGSENGLEPIAEFPGFSFILGDLHPHVLALPFVLLVMAVALVWWLKPAVKWRTAVRSWQFGLTALIVGGMAFLNTWDVLIALFIVVGAVALALWRDYDAFLWDALPFAGVLLVVGAILYFPFYLGFSSQAGAPFVLPVVVKPTRLVQFLTVFGLPLLVIVPLLGAYLFGEGNRWFVGLGWFVGLVGGLLVLNLAFLPFSPVRPEIGELLGAKVGNPWVVLLLGGIFGVVVVIATRYLGEGGRKYSIVSSQQSIINDGGGATVPFVLLLILTGVLLTLGTEFLFLKDNFSARMNTIFKFYYQTWALWGVASVVGLHLLWQKAKPVAGVVGGVYVALFLVCMSFPVIGVRTRAAEYSLPPTLDGMAYLEQGERDAFEWLRETGSSDTVTLEAIGGAYSSYSRVSASTGVPTPLGWANHERQWRRDASEVGRREPLIDQIYTQPSWDGIPDLLDDLNVTYIYVGPQERGKYASGLDKFSENLDVAFQNETVTIYAWKPNS